MRTLRKNKHITHMKSSTCSQRTQTTRPGLDKQARPDSLNNESEARHLVGLETLTKCFCINYKSPGPRLFYSILKAGGSLWRCTKPQTGDCGPGQAELSVCLEEPDGAGGRGYWRRAFSKMFCFWNSFIWSIFVKLHKLKQTPVA